MAASDVGLDRHSRPNPMRHLQQLHRKAAFQYRCVLLVEPSDRVLGQARRHSGAGPNTLAPSLVGRVIQSGTAKSILMTDELT
jgi:hypothetical protein